MKGVDVIINISILLIYGYIVFSLIAIILSQM